MPAETAPPYHVLRGPWTLHTGLFALLVVTTCLVYHSDVDLGFFHVDDTGYVTENPWIKSLSVANLKFILTQPYFANYSPLHLLSYMTDYALAGENARAFHLSSNLWAGCVAGLLYLLALVLVRSPGFAFTCALLFVFHPVHVEAVAWISSRKDLVAAAFALPSMLAYFLYRCGGRRARAWYVVSLLLFLLAVAGKLSVVVIPAVLFVFDLAVEKRRGWQLFLDKVPHVLIVVFFGLRVMSSQPETRHDHDLFTFGHSLVQSLILLTGFGEYVMNRPRPDAAEAATWVAVVCRAVPFILFLGPLVFRRKLPGHVTGFVYWVLLALVPPLVLSFVHPVTDRYMFFPSVGVTLLVGWGLYQACTRSGKAGQTVVAVVFLVLLFGWARKTKAYLDEWQDPRSVWFAAAQKNDDVRVFQYLGAHYQDAADGLAARLAGDASDQRHAEILARTVWVNDERLPQLMDEWSSDTKRGPTTRMYEDHLRELAMAEFARAVQAKKTRISPNLYFRLGKIQMDTGRLDEAYRNFQQAYQEAARHTSTSVKSELTVRSYHALGLVEWRRRNYEEADEWLARAETEQTRLGGRWVPDLARHRQKLQGLMNR